MANTEEDGGLESKFRPRSREITQTTTPDRWSMAVIASVLLGVFAGLTFWIAGDVLLLIFTGLLLSLLLINLSRIVEERTGLGYHWSLACVLGTLAIALGLLTALFAARIAGEATELFHTVQTKWRDLSAQFQQYPWVPTLEAPSLTSIKGLKGDWVSRIAAWFTSTLGIFSSLILIVFIGVFTAVDPKLYRRGLLHLVPISRRERVSQVVEETSHKLWWWILGQLFSMSVVGIATGIGLWLLDIPFAPTLGLLSGLLTFIPNFGPILSAVPAILLSLSHGPMQAVYVVLLYIGTQAIESNLLTPLIQQRNVKLPPVLNVGFQVLLGVLFGVPGLIVAAPLAVVVMIATQRFYVEDYLGASLSPEQD